MSVRVPRGGERQHIHTRELSMYHHYPYHHGFNLGEQIAGAAVRGVVYQAERQLFHGMSLPEILLIGGGICVAVLLFMRRR